MIGEPVDFRIERVNRAKDNTEISVEDLLRAILQDIQTGKAKPTSCLVILSEEGEDGWDASGYRAGLTRQLELTLLEWAKDKLTSRWFRGA